MKPYPYLPGVPAAGHIARGYWHPGTIGNCPTCTPTRPTPAERDAVVRDLGTACPDCSGRLAYTATPCVLLVHCRATDTCGYRRTMAWDHSGRITTHETPGKGRTP